MAFVKTGFLCVALAVPVLTLWTRLALNSEIYLPLPLEFWDYKFALPLSALLHLSEAELLSL